MAKHFRTPEDDQTDTSQQTPRRGNPRARYLQEQAEEPRDSSDVDGTLHNRHRLEPLDSFPAYEAPSVGDAGEQNPYADPVEQPLPYGNAPRNRTARPHNPVQPTHHSGHRRRSNRKKRWPIVVAVVIVALVVAVGGCGLALLNDAKAIKSKVSQYTSEVSALQQAVLSGDGDQAASAASQLSSTAQAMKSQTDGVLWSLGSLVPIYGTDISQAKELTQALADLTDNGVVPAVDTIKGYKISDLFGDGGTVNLDMLSTIATALESLKNPLQRTANTVNDMQPFHVESIESTMGTVRDTLSSADTLVQQAGEILSSLPGMLGANGESKTYLMVAQNNVEVRGAGGFPGSSGTLTVTNGSMALGDFTTIAGKRTDTWSPEVQEDEVAFINNSLLDNPGSATSTPQFPRAAQIYASEWEYWQGGTLDGVVAIDPVFLQRLLRLTNTSVTVDGVEVNGDNAAQVLMSDTYSRYATNDEMDAFFAAVAAEAFHGVLNNLGSIDPFQLLEVVNQATADHRLQVWMANEDYEKVIEKVGASGELSTDETAPVVGVYVNDYTWSKIDWYLDMKTTVGASTKNADGSTTYEVTTTATNTMTEEEAQTLPDYVVGSNPDKRSRGDMVTLLLLLAPAGGTISDIQATGGVFSNSHGTLYGFDGERCMVQEEPGETTTITYKVTTATTATQPLAVRQTPLAHDTSQAS